MLVVKILVLIVAFVIGVLVSVRVWHLRNRPPTLNPPSPGYVPTPGDAGVDLGGGPSL